MAEIKCRMCGGDIIAAAGQTCAKCEACGCDVTLPKACDSRMENLFNGANRFRMTGEFETAAAVYETILREDQTSAEAHWGLMLSRYGIEYVEDRVSHGRIPVCRSMRKEPILENADYLAALEYAPDDRARSIYEAEGRRLSELQQIILQENARKEAQQPSPEAPAVPGVESLYKRAGMFLEDGDFARAREYFDRILDIDPEFAPAYIGKLCADRRVRTEAELKNGKKPLEAEPDYQKALRFANPQQEAVYAGYSAAVREKIDAANQRKVQQKREASPKSRRNRRLIIAAAALVVVIVLGVVLNNVRKEAYYDKIAPVGSYVTFGTYPQSADGNDETPIEWLVLARDGNKALLISRYGLDAQPYNEEYEDVTWETCTLRTWLNDDFMNRAFTAEEQAAILLTDVDNSEEQCFDWYKWAEDNGYDVSYWPDDVTGGNDTQDKIFLLSYAEANKYLGVTIDDYNNTRARVAPTEYALVQGAYTDDGYKTAEGESGGWWWWLRSPGRRQSYASSVRSDGFLGNCSVDYDDFCVCPALWVNLESGIF